MYVGEGFEQYVFVVLGCDVVIVVMQLFGGVVGQVFGCFGWSVVEVGVGLVEFFDFGLWCFQFGDIVGRKCCGQMFWVIVLIDKGNFYCIYCDCDELIGGVVVLCDGGVQLDVFGWQLGVVGVVFMW